MNPEEDETCPCRSAVEDVKLMNGCECRVNKRERGTDLLVSNAGEHCRNHPKYGVGTMMACVLLT